MIAGVPVKTHEDALKETVEQALGERIRSDDEFASLVWGSFANVGWIHPQHGRVGLTWRQAAGMIAEIRGGGGADYMSWYDSANPGVVNNEVREALVVEGWSPDLS